MQWTRQYPSDYKRKWHVAPAPQGSVVYKAHTWCCDHQSNGYFYNHYSDVRWYFENKSDALLFTLRWSGLETHYAD